jgi:hypothetical protein
MPKADPISDSELYEIDIDARRESLRKRVEESRWLIE